MRRVWTYPIGVGNCLVLALVWGTLALSGNALAAPGPETKCGDGRDNDRDGLIDCCDPDCCGDAACGGTGCPDVAPCTGGGGGGGGDVGQHIAVCISFDEGLGIGTDNLVDPSYCEGDSNGKVAARVGRNLNTTLDGNSSNRKTAGRTFFLDLSAGLACAWSVNVDVDACVGCEDCVDGLEPDLPLARFGDPDPGQKFGLPDNAKFAILGRDLDDLLVGSAFETNAQLTFSVGRENYLLDWGPFKKAGGTTRCPESYRI